MRMSSPLSLELSAASLRIFKWNGVYDSNKIYFISAASLKTLSYSTSGEALCLTLRTDDQHQRNTKQSFNDLLLPLLKGFTLLMLTQIGRRRIDMAKTPAKVK